MLVAFDFFVFTRVFVFLVDFVETLLPCCFTLFRVFDAFPEVPEIRLLLFFVIELSTDRFLEIVLFRFTFVLFLEIVLSRFVLMAFVLFLEIELSRLGFAVAYELLRFGL